MRILYVNSFYRPHIGGGAELTLESIVEGMAARGHDVAVLSTSSWGAFAETKVGSATVFRYAPRNVYWNLGPQNNPRWKRLLFHILDIWNTRSYGAMMEAIGRFRPDVISFHNLSGISISVWAAAKREGIPTVQVLHDLYLSCPSSLMFRKNKACQNQCLECRAFRAFVPHNSKSIGALVGVSGFVLRKITASGGFAKSTHRVIYNARNLTVPPNVPQAGNPVRVGYIGTVMPAKGLEVLVREFAKVRGARLRIAGSGDPNYVKTLASLAPADRVEFLGHQPSPQFYRETDILVVPSLWNDTLPGVAFEALAYGIPVIASNRGGLPEIVQDGTSGLIFDPDVEGSLQEQLQLLIDDSALRSSMATAAVGASARFTDYPRMIREHEQLYIELVGQTDPSAS